MSEPFAFEAAYPNSNVTYPSTHSPGTDDVSASTKLWRFAFWQTGAIVCSDGSPRVNLTVKYLHMVDKVFTPRVDNAFILQLQDLDWQ